MDLLHQPSAQDIGEYKTRSTTMALCFAAAPVSPCGTTFIGGTRVARAPCRHAGKSAVVAVVGADERRAARRSLDKLTVPPFLDTVRNTVGMPALKRRDATTLQINIGLTCNLACRHCHVESSPARKETMMRSVAERLVELVRGAPSLRVVDITGGAPEMHAEFRFLVEAFSELGLQVLDRCNLVVLDEPGQEDLVEFLAKHRVKVVASLPCYTPDNVEKQRGDGVFDASIRALQSLNDAGYGRAGTGLELDLVYNPGGPSLPPAQEQLETDYRRELKRAFNIEFSKLICIANMPIKRFADDLMARNQLQDYLDLLVSSFNPSTVDSVMCLDMVHVAWDGRLYDCDFNFALAMTLGVDTAKQQQRQKLPVNLPDGLTVFDIDGLSDLYDRPIHTGVHCYGCTAGSGSSCGGSLAG